MKKMRTSKRFRIYKEARRQLCAAYPAAFPLRGRRPPLKIGILQDLLKEDTVTLPSKKLRIFLSIWTRSTAYLQSVAKRRDRICLKGDLHGLVAENHAAEALELIKSRRSGETKRV